MKFVPTAIHQKIARQGLLAGKNAPTILFATGVAGMVGSTVLACRATLKMEEVVTNTRNDLSSAKAIKFASEGFNGGDIEGFDADGELKVKRHVDYGAYSENDYRKDCAVIYSRALVKAAKLYAPAVIMGAASVACLSKSHDILMKRNAALTAAYIAVDEAFKEYRERVVEKYGEEEDREFRYGVQEVDYIDDNGKIYTEKQPGDLPSMYARFFDEYSSSWSKEPEYNYVFLSCTQKMANDQLKARGHLFLNEVYDMLGIDRTQAGQAVGWVLSPDGDGDNYVDFGIFKGRGWFKSKEDMELRDFINGRNNSILLDFNVDGVIYDKIDPGKERLKWQS
jgi:hypothetical protein